MRSFRAWTVAAFLSASLLIVATVSPGMAQGGFTDDEANAIQTFLRENFDNSNLGMVIGLVDERSARIFSAGRLDNGTDKRVDGDTLYWIGSVTKTFTVLLLQDMVERRKMRLDDPVAKYLPKSVKMPSRGGKEITLLDLATHTSGLPFDAGLDESPNAPGGNPFHRLTNEKLYAFLSSLTLGRDPGAAYSYSNVGMALLAHAIERRAGVSYEKLVLDRICRPLGMNNTRITLTPQLKSRLATGHDQAGKCVPYWDIGAYAGAGAIRSTANDLLKYVSANLGIKQSRLTPLMQSTHEVRHTNSPGPIEGENHRNTGMAWTDLGIYQPPGMQIIGHPGGAGGYSAFIGMDKKQRRGAVVLVNQFQGRLNPSVVGCAILQRVGLTKDTTTALVLELAGVGAALATDEKTRLVRITKVYNDTPAAKAGLTEGQLISRIDNTPTTGKTVAECAGLIRGPVGTKVRLELTDPEGKGTKIVEITRHKFVTTG